jgi:hypothetical protein
MKRFISMLIMVMMFVSFAAQSDASEEQLDKPIVVFVNYNKVVFPDDVNPYINVAQRTMVPVRGVFEQMHATITWRRNERGLIEVTATHPRGKVILTVGNHRALVNGKWVELDAPPELINDRVSVPLRFLSGIFGGEVTWVSRQESGHAFDYIHVEGQFRYQSGAVKLFPQIQAVGYGKPWLVDRFPIMIEGKHLRLTIHNITNGAGIHRMPGHVKMISPIHLHGRDEYYGPFFDAEELARQGISIELNTGLLRIDVEYEALSENGYSYDETKMNEYTFDTTSFFNKYDTFYLSTVHMQMKDGLFLPQQFAGFRQPVWLARGERIRTIIPLQYYISVKNPNVLIGVNLSGQLEKLALLYQTTIVQ